MLKDWYVIKRNQQPTNGLFTLLEEYQQGYKIFVPNLLFTGGFSVNVVLVSHQITEVSKWIENHLTPSRGFLVLLSDNNLMGIINKNVPPEQTCPNLPGLSKYRVKVLSKWRRKCNCVNR